MIFILASTLDGTIGVDGHLPWSIPDEYMYFLHQTRSKRVLCGRHTFESIRAENVLDHFEHVYVLTHHPNDVEARLNVTCVSDVADVPDRDDVWCIGGTSLYNEIATLRPTDVYLTRVYGPVRDADQVVKLGDAFWQVLQDAYTCQAAQTKWLCDQVSMQKVECEFLHYHSYSHLS